MRIFSVVVAALVGSLGLASFNAAAETVAVLAMTTQAQRDHARQKLDDLIGDRSRALRAQRRPSRRRADAGHRRADDRLDRRGLSRDAAVRPHTYPSQIRQPILILAAGNDTIVSNSAIEEYAHFLRAGTHLVINGAKHELLQEQDRYRAQFWAAFDAFVPGTPLFG